MRVWSVLLLGVALLSTRAAALETDQFTVPAQPLVDLGPVVDDKVAFELQQVIAHAKVERASELEQARTTHWKWLANKHRQQADDVISSDGVADAFYHAIAGGSVPECKIEDWILEKHTLRAALLQPMSVSDSVYGANPFERPFLLIELSPTVRLHDRYVGVDKLGHFFQQGHEYYERFVEARAAGKTEAEATRLAVAGGVKQEHGFYGEAIIGIYSNADLAANYAGLLFYRNLFEPVTIGHVTLPPMITRDGDTLVLDERVKMNVTQPFITEHWNEAMNPCHYVGYWRPYVKERIAAKVDAWMAFNHSTPALEAARLQRITTFDGTDYGHSGFRDVITLTNATLPDSFASR